MGEFLGLGFYLYVLWKSADEEWGGRRVCWGRETVFGKWGECLADGARSGVVRLHGQVEYGKADRMGFFMLFFL